MLGGLLNAVLLTRFEDESLWRVDSLADIGDTEARVLRKLNGGMIGEWVPTIGSLCCGGV